VLGQVGVDRCVGDRSLGRRDDLASDPVGQQVDVDAEEHVVAANRNAERCRPSG
jgi:hypothetical protein